MQYTLVLDSVIVEPWLTMKHFTLFDSTTQRYLVRSTYGCRCLYNPGEVEGKITTIVYHHNSISEENKTLGCMTSRRRPSWRQSIIQCAVSIYTAVHPKPTNSHPPTTFLEGLLTALLRRQTGTLEDIDPSVLRLKCLSSICRPEELANNHERIDANGSEDVPPNSNAISLPK